MELPDSCPMGANRQTAVSMPFSVYLHFPFCRNKCSYCDFYKELYDPVEEKRFYDALLVETRRRGEAWPSDDRIVTSIFVGGGTPSLTRIEFLTAWLEELKRQFTVLEGLEFSIENNPESVTVDLLKSYRSLGINRPTYGIQSFDQRLLKLLDRKHHVEDSHRAVYLTNALRFTTFGTDLIFALPRQTTRMLSSDLDQLIELDPPHVSFYQLTVEPGTPLARKVEKGRVKPIDDELALAMYRGGSERLADAGYVRYEVSSFAKPGHECRHNISYWEGQDYLGLGPSAHSFVRGRRFANVSSVARYVQTLQAGDYPVEIDESGVEQRMIEAIMLGLRMTKGIDRRQFAERFGRNVEDQLDRRQYEVLVESGHVIPDRGRIRLSETGFYLADEITRRLLK